MPSARVGEQAGGEPTGHVGRRPVVLACLGLEIVSMLVFGLADNEVALVVARMV